MGGGPFRLLDGYPGLGHWMHFKLRIAVYRGEPADIITFVIAGDGNKDESLKSNKYPGEQIADGIRQTSAWNQAWLTMV